MVRKAVDAAEVLLWGRRIGAVCWEESARLAAFEFDPVFQLSGVELAPLTMPLGPSVYRFPELRNSSFRGLPGLLADSLLGDFGAAALEQWCLRENIASAGFSPVAQLRYLGKRGMGALEFRPGLRNTTRGCVPVDVPTLVERANQVLALHAGIKIRLRAKPDGYARQLDDILRVGTSAGGTSAKAVIAWNPETRELRAGQMQIPDNFQHWLLKLDGVSGAGARRGNMGRIEYAYARMAALAGIRMPECRLLEEDGRGHFMTRRFDRGKGGEKKHVQSLYAIAHLDEQGHSMHSYERAFAVMRRLGVADDDVAELFRRMVFSVVACNQNDSTRHVAFLMDKAGRWSLSPAFDVVCAYNPADGCGSPHRMTINGRYADITASDLLAVASRCRVSGAEHIVDEVESVVRRWPDFAAAAGVPASAAGEIAAAHCWPR